MKPFRLASGSLLVAVAVGLATTASASPPDESRIGDATGSAAALRVVAQRSGTAHSLKTAESSPCRHCGTVESVRAVREKGAGTGLGAVAGGVAGGVVGHQLGGGSGKDAMTVLGAVGGAVAGHQVEKHARGRTAYQVRVRLDDGSIRTFTRSQAPARGDRVAVEGDSLRVIARAKTKALRG